MHPKIFKNFHKTSFFFLKFCLHKSSTNVLDEVMGGFLSNNGGEEDGSTPS